jgi:hypothetical protein
MLSAYTIFEIIEQLKPHDLPYRCVSFDGTRWSQHCSVGAYSSSHNHITCTRNMAVSVLAIAADEFVIDCKGTLGGSLVLDACST